MKMVVWGIILFAVMAAAAAADNYLSVSYRARTESTQQMLGSFRPRFICFFIGPSADELHDKIILEYQMTVMTKLASASASESSA